MKLVTILLTFNLVNPVMAASEPSARTKKPRPEKAAVAANPVSCSTPPSQDVEKTLQKCDLTKFTSVTQMGDSFSFLVCCIYK